MDDEQRAWLISELRQPWKGRTVVVTHHARSGSVAGEMTPLSPCFASDRGAEIEQYRPDIWLFGHIHRAAEGRMPGGTLLPNVSVGYEDELRQGGVEERVQRGLIGRVQG